jgi:hypothetical protein
MTYDLCFPSIHPPTTTNPRALYTVFERLSNPFYTARHHIDVFLSDQLRRHYTAGQYHIEVDIDHVRQYKNILAEKLKNRPSDTLPLVSPLRCGPAL